MGKYRINGLRRLEGTLQVQGSKNAALPILAAALLVPESTVHNCPELSDVEAAVHILEELGCRCHREGGSVTVTAGECLNSSIPEALMREMRSSVVFLGAMIARCGRARISLPGGCELGPRPIDMHLSGLQKLGVTVLDDRGYLDCRAANGLHGARIALPFPSVGATENIMIAASVAKGMTEIHNAAREPEISNLADFLNAAGARVQIALDGTVYVEGVPKLHACEYAVIPDRIAAATYLCAAAATGSRLQLAGINPIHLTACIPLYEEAGCTLRMEKNSLELYAPASLKALRMVRTMPYPGFPTDAQAPFMAMCCLAKGTSVFVENIFENRYKHAGELSRMGAQIKLEGRVAVVEGAARLHGARVECTDLRGGAALVIAALAAEGETVIDEIRHLERGYEALERNLCALGADIKKLENGEDFC
ncbi:MAG: UDP-N-acetylglucosamine 1-carboxyvinyltransferase [Provencibacterium sp.]|jgi:UDP-N-acetylglucosamine 1-carboxyvinyltransferase|nr:UDP-N-acetylglucosamine 1-carboxyvinyltransferase [Provencibacterium sp.]